MKMVVLPCFFIGKWCFYLGKPMVLSGKIVVLHRKTCVFFLKVMLLSTNLTLELFCCFLF